MNCVCKPGRLCAWEFMCRFIMIFSTGFLDITMRAVNMALDRICVRESEPGCAGKKWMHHYQSYALSERAYLHVDIPEGGQVIATYSLVMSLKISLYNLLNSSPSSLVWPLGSLFFKIKVSLFLPSRPFIWDTLHCDSYWATQILTTEHKWSFNL